MSTLKSPFSKKRIILIILSAVIITAAAVIILYETVWLTKIRSPYKTYYFPLWEVHNNVGFTEQIKTDDISPLRFPAEFPKCHRDAEGKELIAYPAALCRKCGKPFPFYTKTFSPDMKPEKCINCSNTDPETLIVLLSAEMIIEYKLRKYFYPFWEDEFIKSIDLWDKVLEVEKHR